MKMRSRLGSIVLRLAGIGLFTTALVAPADRTKQKPTDSAPARVQLTGEQTRDYLLTEDGKSLMEAFTAARFALQWQERPPGQADQHEGGYLGLSHEQNLNAWFGEDGMTMRPTAKKEKPEEGWRMDLRLKAYGYGRNLVEAPPIVSRTVKGNRIEYVRANQLSEARDQSSAELIEWYENQTAGVEQGFTLNVRPEKKSDIAVKEPLRVSLAVEGDLRARLTEADRQIELVNGQDSGVVSYTKLAAVDADRKQLIVWMEASSDGREIILVVNDSGARYPIVIDPIMASLEQKLRSEPPQTDARFGTAVAIDGNLAVVGAWREDVGANADVGAVYVFVRSGTYPNSAWTLDKRFGPVSGAGQQCGMSVAINGNRIAYGCPGDNGTKGTAFYMQRNSPGNHTGSTVAPGGFTAGDLFGISVAINGDIVVVGSPGEPYNAEQNAGAARISKINANGTTSLLFFVSEDIANNRLGAAVALDSTYPNQYTLIIGKPGIGAGSVLIEEFDAAGYSFHSVTVTPPDGNGGDQFGQSVALSGHPGSNTAVVGAWGNDAKGTDAGAAYVFERVQTTLNWNFQQKLTASDGSPYNYFSVSAVAIQDNTIVVGAYGWDGGTPLLIDDDRGAAYIFSRSGTTWTQQREILAADGQRGDNFGIGVGISGDSVIVGARHALALSTAAAGAAYVYHLDCVPPYGSHADFGMGNTSSTFCPGSPASLRVVLDRGVATAYQWRKNGVNIPGATSSTYNIASVKTSDAGNYDVVVSNACGSDISSAAELDLYFFSLNPTSQNFGAGGSNGIVNVTPDGNCSWTATSNAAFITVTSGKSGTGKGTVGFTVAANPNAGQRTGTITIANRTFSVSQDGINCSYSIAPSSKSLAATASTNTVNVTANPGCAWTATNNAPSFVKIDSGANGSGNGAVTYTVSANSTTTQRTGTLTIAGQTFTITQAAAQRTTLANISTRLRVETGDNVLIGGFIITGTQDKNVIIRAIGPSLSLPGKLGNPILELRNSAGTLLKQNGDWKNSSAADRQAIIDTTIAPTNDLESAIVATLPANGASYTAIVRGVNNTTGIGVVEVYDLNRNADSILANISTRGLVQTGDTVLIAGTIVLGPSSRKVIIRAIGPSLNVPGKLQNPTLELRNGSGTLLDANDNWKNSPDKQAIINSTVPPTNDLESAIVATLPGGGASYTAIVRGVNNTTGIAVVEVYALQ